MIPGQGWSQPPGSFERVRKALGGFPADTAGTDWNLRDGGGVYTLSDALRAHAFGRSVEHTVQQTVRTASFVNTGIRTFWYGEADFPLVPDVAAPILVTAGRRDLRRRRRGRSHQHVRLAHADPDAKRPRVVHHDRRQRLRGPARGPLHGDRRGPVQACPRARVQQSPDSRLPEGRSASDVDGPVLHPGARRIRSEGRLGHHHLGIGRDLRRLPRHAGVSGTLRRCPRRPL